MGAGECASRGSRFGFMHERIPGRCESLSAERAACGSAGLPVGPRAPIMAGQSCVGARECFSH